MYVSFFQAEDGIRARNVTGVQTCALPILGRTHAGGGVGALEPTPPPAWVRPTIVWTVVLVAGVVVAVTVLGLLHQVILYLRSEEGRVGKGAVCGVVSVR